MVQEVQNESLGKLDNNVVNLIEHVLDRVKKAPYLRNSASFTGSFQTSCHSIGVDDNKKKCYFPPLLLPAL